MEDRHHDPRGRQLSGIPRATLDILFFPCEDLAPSREFELGLRELRRRLPQGLRWHHLAPGKIPSVGDFLSWSEAPFLLVFLNPALGISDNLLTELMELAAGERVDCVLPGDARGFAPGVSLDYANRSGFDRFVERLAAAERSAAYDGRSPWLYLVRRSALERLVLAGGAVDWTDVPSLLGEGAVIAWRAFVHSYADYYTNDREDVLQLVPSRVRTLLDVGGGAGGFARSFASRRGGQATLLEANPQAAGQQVDDSVEVLVGDFLTVQVGRQFDCVALLEVLEHLDDPLAALLRAGQLLNPGGTLLLSVPNVGHWSVAFDLLEGRFDYQPVGILCNTHKVFFTRQSLQTLLDDAGFKVSLWHDVSIPLPGEVVRIIDELGRLGVAVDRDSLATAGFYVLAEKA